MIVTSITMFSFKVPENYKQMNEFMKSNDMNEWTEDSTTEFVNFTKKNVYFIEGWENKENGSID